MHSLGRNQPKRHCQVYSIQTQIGSHIYLSEANEKSHSSELLPILDRTHEGSKRTPQNSQTRQENARSHPSEDHIRGNLENKVGDEEEKDDDGVL